MGKVYFQFQQVCVSHLINLSFFSLSLSLFRSLSLSLSLLLNPTGLARTYFKHSLSYMHATTLTHAHTHTPLGGLTLEMFVWGWLTLEMFVWGWGERGEKINNYRTGARDEGRLFVRARGKEGSESKARRRGGGGGEREKERKRESVCV